MRGNEDPVLEDIARLLAAHGGQYIFSVDGRQYVVVAREDTVADREQQGVLPIDQRGGAMSTLSESEPGDAAVLAQINRDIALYRQHLDDELTAGDVVLEGAGGEIARVRFEPLRGDLPPELQE